MNQDQASSAIGRFISGKKVLLTRITILLVFLLIAVVAIAIEKPTGAIKGNIAIERAGFGLASMDIQGKKVYVLAVGPRTDRNPIERGVWVKPDGTFQLGQLPVGEYTLRLRAPGYSTETRSGIFVDEGKATNVYKTVVMHPMVPTVNVASNSRVFTTKETPSFWLNSNGATDATVKVYKADIYKALQNNSKTRPLDFGGELAIYKSSGLADNPYKNQTPVSTLNRHLETDSEDWAHAEFKLNSPLPPGDYIAIAEVENRSIPKEALTATTKKSEWNLMWFNVTDIGLVMKQAPDKWVARAIDLNTLKPVSNVDIQLIDRDTQGGILGAPLGKSKTDANGFVDISLKNFHPKSYGYQLMAYATANLAGKTQHTYGGIQYWQNDSDLYHTYFYTERPVYRLGQSVYFKGIVRKKDVGGFHNPGGNLPVSIKVEDPDNNKLEEFDVSTTQHGTFNGVIDIPQDGKTGAYQVTLTYPDGSEDFENFEVAQYRKPEYQVDVLPLVKGDGNEPVMAGDSVKARIRATYYFGAPVANAVVKYSIYAKTDWNRRHELIPRPDYYGYFDSWDSYDDSDYAGEYISEGYAQTDEAGEALISFDTKSNTSDIIGPYSFEPTDKRYKIQAEVTDLSRMSVIGSSSVPVSAGQFALFVDSEKEVYKAGEDVSISINTKDYQGKPIANQPVSVKIKRWVWDEGRQEYRGDETVASAEAKTHASGNLRLKFPMRDSLATDTYYVTVSSKDNAGHTIQDQASLWIANANAPFILSSHESDKQPLTITLDKAVYKPNDTARVMIAAPTNGRENVSAIVAVEGRTLHHYFAVPLTSTAQLVEIPVIGQYAPNAYVSVTIVGKKKQYYHDSKMLKVSPESHFMRIAVTSDKAKYHPGDTVKYTVQATDTTGKPVPNAEVSLGVVDESIYTIRPEAAGPMASFFYRRIENDVLTANSFPEEYSAGPDKIEPRVRKDFRDMAGWFPTLVTNTQGLATTSIKLPDNLTTWRATARAIAGDAEVGENVQKIISTQDLIVRLALPRFYTQGDESLVTAIVHNYTDSEQPIHFSLKLDEPLQVSDIQKNPLNQEVKLASDKATRLQWPITAIKAGKLTISAKAIGKTAGDAIEQSVSVLPLGVEQTEHQSWILSNASPEVKTSLKLPNGVKPNETQYTLTASNSAMGAVLSNLANLVEYPYGCTEQTMSRLVPSAIVLRLHQSLGVPISQETQNKVLDVRQKALVILKDHQNSDGGWGWWTNDTSNFMMTSYVLEQNLLLKSANLGLPEEQITAGKNWLETQNKELFKQLSDPKLLADKWQTRERMLDFAQANATLSAYGVKTPASTFQWIKKNPGMMSSEALSYWTLAAARQHDTTNANYFWGKLSAIANHTNPGQIGFMDWDHTPALLKRLGLKPSEYSYRYSGLESTVLGFKAMLSLKDAGIKISQVDIDAVKNWVLLQRGKDSQNSTSWDNTKTTAQVLSVLLDEELAYQAENGTSSTLQLLTEWLNTPSENAKQTISFDASTRYQPENVLWDGKLNSIVNTTSPTLSLAVQGSGRLYINQWLHYWLPLTPGQAIPLAGFPDGLIVQREFFRLKPKVVDNEGTIRFTLEPLSAGLFSASNIKAGESLLMQTKVKSPVALPYVMLNVPLPSGGEIVSEDPRLNLLASEESDDSNNSGWDFMNYWWTHQDILDDRMVFFASNLPAGESHFQAIIRMEMPGTMQLNPAALTTMYHPDIHAYSPLDQLRVVE